MEPRRRRQHLPWFTDREWRQSDVECTADRHAGRPRSYTARDTRLHVDFKLTKEEGQWRIGPAGGLLVAESSFTRFYTAYSVYFVGNGRLVPDEIYLPDLRSQSNIASVLMKACWWTVGVAQSRGDQQHSAEHRLHR